MLLRYLLNLNTMEGFGRKIRFRVEGLIVNRQLRGLGRMPIHETKIVCP